MSKSGGIFGGGSAGLFGNLPPSNPATTTGGSSTNLFGNSTHSSIPAGGSSTTASTAAGAAGTAGAAGGVARSGLFGPGSSAPAVAAGGSSTTTFGNLGRSSTPTTTTGGSSTTASTTASSFGSLPTPATTTGGGSLFSNLARSSTPTTTTGGSSTTLFGNPARSPTPATTTGGSSTTASTTASATGGVTHSNLFGSPGRSSTSPSGNMFGGATSSPTPATGGGLFSNTTPSSTPATGGLFSNTIPSSTGGWFSNTTFSSTPATGGGPSLVPTRFSTPATTTDRDGPSTPLSRPRTGSLFGPSSSRVNEPPTAAQEGSTQTTNTVDTTGVLSKQTSILFGCSAPVKDGTASVQFDPNGDVILVLKSSSGTARFQVNSGILCLASPVFRAMLGVKSQFKEGKELASREPGAEPLEITLEDDNPNALAIILRILHHQHDLVPKFVAADKEKLYQIAVVCDKYDLKPAVTFWFDIWIGQKLVDSLFGSCKPPVDPFIGEKGLFIAYVFAKVDIFKATSRDIILNWKPPPPLFGMPSSTTTPNFGHVSQAIVDEILESRSSAIKALLNCVTTHILLYNVTTSVQCTMKKPECDAFALGYLTRESQKLGIYKGGLQNKSITEIRDIILKLKNPHQVIFDATSSCCSKPTSCKCGGGSLGCRDCSVRNCTNCRGKYTPAIVGANHAGCVPIAAIKAEVASIVGGINGLAHSRFVRNTKKESTSVMTDSGLWDCLKYV